MAAVSDPDGWAVCVCDGVVRHGCLIGIFDLEISLMNNYIWITRMAGVFTFSTASGLDCRFMI